MADFADLAEADARAQAKVLDGTWIEAYGELDKDGVPKVRFLRNMFITDVAAGTFDTMNEAGAWDESKSNTAT